MSSKRPPISTISTRSRTGTLNPTNTPHPNTPMRRSVSPRNESTTSNQNSIISTVNTNNKNSTPTTTNNNIQNNNTDNNNTSNNNNDNESDDSYNLIAPQGTTIPHPPSLNRTHNNTASNNNTNNPDILSIIRDFQDRLLQYEQRFTETQQEIRMLNDHNQHLEDELARAIDRERELQPPRPPDPIPPPPPDTSSDDDWSDVTSLHPDPPIPPPPALPQPHVQPLPVQPQPNPVPQVYQPPNLIQQPQALDPATALILTQLIQAQQQSNTIQAQARADEHRARIESTPAKFPKLNCLSDETITSWYPKVLGIIKQPKYSVFYDPISSDLVPDGNINPHLNTILYAELLPSLSTSIQDYIYNKHSLQNDGVAIIHDINTSFQQSWNQVQKDNHQRSWMNLRAKPDENYHDFFSRCIKHRNLSITHGIPCSESDLKHRFIMGLPSIFTSIQEKAHDLPVEWQTASIHKLPSLAEQHKLTKESVRNLHRVNKRDQQSTSSSIPSNQQSTTQNNRQQQSTGNSQQRPAIDPITQQRQNSIYAAIMGVHSKYQITSTSFLLTPAYTMEMSILAARHHAPPSNASMLEPTHVAYRIHPLSNNSHPHQPHNNVNHLPPLNNLKPHTLWPQPIPIPSIQHIHTHTSSTRRNHLLTSHSPIHLHHTLRTSYTLTTHTHTQPYTNQTQTLPHQPPTNQPHIMSPPTIYRKFLSINYMKLSTMLLNLMTIT